MQIEEEIITIGDIIKILPHRYPFLLVDKVLSYIPKSHIIGIKNVTINEPQFQGHFPQAPIMPGVLIIEAMAQLCGIFAFKEFDLQAQNKMVSFAPKKCIFRILLNECKILFGPYCAHV